MSYNGAENLHTESCNKKLFIEENFSYTGTINSSCYVISGEYQLIKNDTTVRITKYSHTRIKTYLEISFTSILLRLKYRIWFNQTGTGTTSGESSSKENKEGFKKSYIPRNIIVKLPLILHNKDPPY